MSNVDLAIDEALGPGLDVVVDAGTARATGVRAGAWLGLDRAHLVDSDTDDGTEMAAVVALPASSFAGCHLSAELLGALVDGPRTVLVARLPGQPVPPDALVRTVTGAAGGHWVGAVDAERIARDARQRFRMRRQAGRMLGGRAWQPVGTDPAERRFTTPHSKSEYRLDRLPPRFLRGLEGLLDDDERIIYAIERPPDAIRGGRLGFGRRAFERRAGLLLLTDRQLIWMVDHMPPDRYLLDWGVDARLVAIEALRGVRLSGHEAVELRVETRGGGASFPLPRELRAEAEVLRDLLLRFAPPAGGSAIVRRYAPEATDFDPRPAALFGQAEEAAREVAAITEGLAPDQLLGAFYAPRREGARRGTTVAVTTARIGLLESGTLGTLDLSLLRDVTITLSPLVGRVELAQSAAKAAPAARRSAAHGISFSYPATASPAATALLRLLRRAWADRASSGEQPVGARAAGRQMLHSVAERSARGEVA